jgi:hypothetical protein
VLQDGLGKDGPWDSANDGGVDTRKPMQVVLMVQVMYIFFQVKGQSPGANLYPSYLLKTFHYTSILLHTSPESATIISYKRNRQHYSLYIPMI